MKYYINIYKQNLKKCKNPIDEKTLLKKVTKKSNEIDTVIRSKKIFLNLNNDQKSIIKIGYIIVKNYIIFVLINI